MTLARDGEWPFGSVGLKKRRPSKWSERGSLAMASVEPHDAAFSRPSSPSPGVGGSQAKRAGWGDLLRKEVHPTPSRISLRSMRADPPPPGEGNVHYSILMP